MRPLGDGYDIHPGYPDNRALVPPPLRPVQAFVNTIDREHGVEGLTGPDVLRELLSDFGLIESGSRVDDADLASALAARESLFDLFVARAGGQEDAESIRLLESIGRDAGLTVRVECGEPRLIATAPGVPGALGTLVAAVQTAAADGSLRRLKACRRDCCNWLFWDGSPPASGVWCSMAVCGNRTKVRRFRDRAAAS